MIVKNRKEEFLSYLEDTSNLKGKADLLYLPEEEQEGGGETVEQTATLEELERKYEDLKKKFS